MNSGLFELTTEDITSFKIGPERHLLPDGGFLVHFLAEFSLILPWVHKDKLVACSPAELVVVCRAPLMECLEGVPEIKQFS